MFSLSVEWKLHPEEVESEVFRSRLQLFSLAGAASRADLSGSVAAQRSKRDPIVTFRRLQARRVKVPHVNTLKPAVFQILLCFLFTRKHKAGGCR